MPRPFQLAFVAVLVIGAPAAAQDAAPPATSAQKPLPSPAGAQVPAQPSTAKPVPAPAPKVRPFRKREAVVVTGPVATYPGFRMMPDGSSRVWLEVSKKVDVTEHKAPGRLTYSLRGVSAPVRTNRLPLLTGWFATPASRIQLVPQDDGVDLVIELRSPAEPTHRILETREGMLLQIDLPRLLTPARPDAPTEPRPNEAKRPVDTKRGVQDDPGF